MKAYGKKDNCWCCGPPYERCELCKPTTIQKKKLRRCLRKSNKNELRKELKEQ